MAEFIWMVVWQFFLMMTTICYFWVTLTIQFTRDSFWWKNCRTNNRYIQAFSALRGHSAHCAVVRGILLIFLEFFFLFVHFLERTENLKSNTTPCWPRLVYIITVATTLNWAPLAVNTSAYAHCPSPIQEIRTSSERCQKHKASNRYCSIHASVQF